MAFTDLQVKNLKPRDDRYIVQEDTAKGAGKLGVRVSPNGHKTWLFTYAYAGKVRRLTLGEYPTMTVAQAGVATAAARQELENGRDPGAIAVEQRAVARQAPTFRELADQFMTEYAVKEKAAKSVQNDRRTLDHDVVPKIGRHKAEAVEKRDIRVLLKAIVDRGAPVQANRTLALVRKIYNWAIEQDILKVNPCIGIKAPGGKEVQRDRVLTEQELQQFLTGLDQARLSPESRLALRFQLLTAQRCGEVLALLWSEIDLAAAWWTIPGPKAKNRKSHRVPLSGQALAVLTEARALNADAKVVFPSPRGDKPMTETAVARALQLNQGAEKPRYDEAKKALPPSSYPDCFGCERFTPHDLRRTSASHMTGMGISRLVVSKLLNHADPAVTAIYDRHSYDAEKRAAIELWGAHVARLAEHAACQAAAAAGLGAAAKLVA